MKFENPIMNISMFALENVVTGSGDPVVTKTDAENAADVANNIENVGKVLTITF